MQDLCDYLKQYNAPQSINLSSQHWKKLLKEVVAGFKSAHEHSFLFDFLQNIGRLYRNQIAFIEDLLRLEVEDLFSGTCINYYR